MLFKGLLLALVLAVNGGGINPDRCITESIGDTDSPNKITRAYFVKAAQPEAEVILLPDPECSLNQTFGLSLTMCDYDNEPKVQIKSDYAVGDLQRTGKRNGVAYVMVQIYCVVEPGPHYLPVVYEEYLNTVRSHFTGGKNN